MLVRSSSKALVQPLQGDSMEIFQHFLKFRKKGVTFGLRRASRG